MKRSKIAVMCVVLFAVVLTLGSSAFAQSKMSTRLQHWTAGANGWQQLQNNSVSPMFWPNGSFGSDSGGTKESTGSDSATWNFGYGVYGYALLWWRSPFAQKWYVEAYIEQAVSYQTIVGVSYIENYYHGINVKLPSGINASSQQHAKRFGKSGYGNGPADATAFIANTVDITDYSYFPYILTGAEGAYSLYIIDKRGNPDGVIADEIPMSGDFYQAESIYNLTYTMGTTPLVRGVNADGGAAAATAGKISKKRVETSSERIAEFKKCIATKKAEMLTAPEGQDANKAVKESSPKDERKIGEKRESRKENRRNTNQSNKRERKATNRRR